LLRLFALGRVSDDEVEVEGLVLGLVLVVGLGLRVGGGGGGSGEERVLVLYSPLGDVGTWLAGVLRGWSELKSEEALRRRRA
jgi:hypothetical protein